MLPPVKSAPREKSDPEVNIRALSEKWNQNLSDYFSATIERTRFYWLIAALIRHHSVRTANAMAFDLFLALVPMLGLGGWAAAVIVGQQGNGLSLMIAQVTPRELQHFVGHHFQALAAAHLAPVAAVAGLWLSSSAFNTLIGVFEETFDCSPRGWIHRRFISLGFAMLGMLLLGLAGGFGVMVAMLTPERRWYDALKESGALHILFVASSFVTISSFLALLYRYSLRRPGKKRHVWFGALAATLLGVGASIGLGYYATNIARFALFYGGLAVIVIVLLWLWLWSSAILIGAELNIAVEDVVVARKAEQSASSELAEIGEAIVHFVADEPEPTPTQSPRSSANSAGD